MALDPLLFKAEINGNALSTLDEIQKKLNSINGASIKIDVADTASLKSLIETLSKAPSIKLGDGLSKEVQAAQAELEKAQQKLDHLRETWKDFTSKSTSSQSTKDIEAIQKAEVAYEKAVEHRIQLEERVKKLQSSQTTYSDDPTIKKLQGELNLLEQIVKIADKYKSSFAKMDDQKFHDTAELFNFKAYEDQMKYLKQAYRDRWKADSAKWDKDPIDQQSIKDATERMTQGILGTAQESFRRQVFEGIKNGMYSSERLKGTLNAYQVERDRKVADNRGFGIDSRMDSDVQAYNFAIKAMKEFIVVAQQVEEERRKLGVTPTVDILGGDKSFDQQSFEKWGQIRDRDKELEQNKQQLAFASEQLEKATKDEASAQKELNALRSHGDNNAADIQANAAAIEKELAAMQARSQVLSEYNRLKEESEKISKDRSYRAEPLGLGTGSQQKHDLLDIANALYKIYDKAPTEDPIGALADKYKITREQAEALIPEMQKAYEVYHKFNIDYKRGELRMEDTTITNSASGYRWLSDHQIREEGATERLDAESKRVRDVIDAQVESAKVLQNLNAEKERLLQTTIKENSAGSEEAELKAKIAEQEQKVAEAKKNVEQVTQQQATGTTQDSFKGLAENITAIKEAIKDDNFSVFSENVNKAVLALNSLAEAFKNLSSYIGEEPVKDLVSGIGQQMTNLATQQQQMQNLGGKGKGGKGNGPTQAQLDKSVQDALYNINKLDILINQARASWNAGANGNDGFNPALKSAIDRVEELRTGLENIASGGGKNASGQTTRIMTGTAEYRIAVEQLKALNSAQNTAISNAIKEEASINAAAVAYERYGVMKKRAEEARDNGLVSGDDVTKVEAYITHLDKVRALMQEIQKNGAVPQSQLAQELGLDAGMDTWTAIKQIGVQKDMIWGKANLGDMTKDLQLSKHNMKEAESEAKKLTVTISNLTAKSEQYKQQGKDTGDLDNLIQKLKDYREVFTEISEKNNVSASSVKLSEDYLQAKRGIKDIGAAEKEQQRVETNQRRYNDALQHSVDLLDRLKQASVTAYSLGLDTTKTDQAAQSLQEVINKIQAFNSQDMGNNHAVSELLATYNGVKTELNAVAKEQEKLNNAKRESLDAQQQKELDDWTKSMNEAKVAATELYVKIEKLKEVRSKANAAGVNTSQLDRHIGILTDYYDKFRDIASGTKGIGTAKELKDSAAYRSERKLADHASEQTAKQVTEAKHKQAQAERQLQREMRKTTSAAHEQHGAMDKLKSMAGQFLSVAFAKRFVTEMMKITGELELQQRSLEVIIGNASKAAELYTNIRDLSQQSPYSFQDLLKSERQLAAFGIQTKDLYGTMKALSDIGAGLSVDVQRLILAYGHTRSYGYLSGIQNRQFETAGIDLIGELTKFYNKQAAEIRKSGGAAKNTSRMELFTRMRKRDISFEDVEQVILALDKPGGKFFNMQEKQFDTLGGKLRNLKNNYNIMMSEMGESSKGMLMGIVNMLNTLTGEWQKYANVLKLVLVPLGSIKVLMMALNTPAKAFAGMHAALKKSQKGWSSLGITIHNVGRGIKGFFKSLGAFLVGPQAAIFALIAALTALWNQARKTNQQIKELTTNMTEHGAADRKNIAEVMETYGNGFVNQRIDSGRTVTKNGVQIIKYKFELDDEELMKADLTGSLADMKEKLQAMSPFYDRDLVNINKLKTQYDQFEALYKKMESLRYASNLKEAFGEAFGFAADQSNGWNATSDTFIQDAKDFQKTLQASFRQIDQMTEAELTQVDQTLNNALTKIKNTLNHADLKESLKYFLFNIEKGYNEAAINAEDTQNLLSRSMTGNRERVRSNNNDWTANLPDVIANAIPDANNLNDSFYEKLKKFVAPKGFGRTLSSQRMELHRGVGPFVEVIKDILGNFQEGEEEYAADAVAAIMQEMIATMGVTMPEAVSTIYDIVLDELKKKYPDIDYGAFFNEQKIITLVNQELNGLIRTNTTREEVWGQNVEDENGVIKHIDGIIDKVREHIKEKAKVLGIDLATLSQDVIGDAVESAFKDVQLNYDWQKRLIGPGGLIQVNSSLQSQLKGISDISEAADAMQKEFDDLMKNLDNYEGAAGGALKEFFGETFKPAKITDDVKKDNQTLASAIRLRISLLENLVAGAENIIKDKGNSEEADKLRNILTNEIQPALDQNKSILEILRASADMKWSIKSGGSYHDEEAKRWDERIRIMKEAYDWYDKWEKKVGKDEAIKKVNDRYQDVFEEWRHDDVLPFNFDTGRIEDYMSYVEEIRDKALAKYQRQKNNEDQNKGQEALRVYRQAVAVLEEGSWDNFVRAAEEFQSIIEKTMEDLQRRWSLFTDIRDKTGNVGLAATLSGVDTSFRTQADAMRAAVQNAYTEAGGEGEVNFDISLDKEAVRAMFEGAIRGDRTDAKYMESIDGLIKGFEEWQKSEEEQEKTDINVTVDLIGSAVDLQSEVQKIATNYNSQLDSLNRQFPNGGEAYNQAKGILDANTQNKLVQAQEAYKLLMDGVITMNIGAARDIREAYVNTLNRQLTAGAITAKEYADQIDAINDRMQALENLQSYQRSYMEQGVSGATDNLAQRGKSLIEQGASIMEMGSQTMNSEMVKMGQYMIQTGQRMKKASQDMNQVVSDMSLIVNGINNMVQSLKGVWDEINSTLQAYGDDTQKYGMGRKVGTFLSSFAEASQGATDAFEALKSGNGAGVLLGVVKSWTSWFRGFAKGNDEENALYRANAESAIKNYGNIRSGLQSDKERSFGYAQMGSYGLRGIANARYNEKILRSFYGSGNWSDATLEAMTSALQSGSAYAGEYATLMAELDSRQNQLSSLESDKDKDRDEIEATKKQIAELEDQIAHFTGDLAKDLWGIDVKSWADQINDALMNAFENGENAAKAYQDTVRNIMQNVTSQIMKMSIIQPMMEKLQKILFGTKDEKGNLQGGVVSTDDLIKDPTGAAKKLVQASNQFFANEGNAMITAAREFYEGMNSGLGGILTNPNANTLSSSIQGTSEETSDLLAGYVSALRQDVAAERILREQFIMEIWPTFVEETMAAVIQPLNQINLNVLAIRQSMTGQGELISAIDDIYSILSAITNGTKEVHMA